MTKRPLPERFWEKVDTSAGADACWPWLASHFKSGYGQFDHWTYAHRLAYELTHGPIAEGLEIDHVRARGCTRKDCVNPRHLEAVTHRINSLRTDSPPALNAKKTHCHRGHPLTPGNLKKSQPGKRLCLTCHRDGERERQARIRASAQH